MPELTVNDLMNTTLPKYSPEIFDNVTKNNALLAVMRTKDNIVRESGGKFLVETLEGAENGTFKWYAGFELLDISASNVLVDAVYAWKQANVNVTVSGVDQRNNEGSDTQIHNLVKTKITNAQNTANNKIGASIFSDGTGSGGKELGGLKLLISDNPATSTVGGINAAQYPFWMNQVYSLSADGGAGGASQPAVTPEDILSAYDTMMLRVVIGTDRPDVIVAGQKHYTLYKRACQVIKRITIMSEKMLIGDASFQAIEYEGIPVVYDPNCDPNRTYFINTNYLKMRVHKSADFTWQPKRTPVNQDADVWPLLFQGNLTCSNRIKQGVIIA